MKETEDAIHLSEEEYASLTAEMDAAYQEAIAGWEPFENDPGFIYEFMKVDFLNQVLTIMEEERVSDAELARRMGVSRARVSHILNETRNFQLKSIAKMAAALDRDVAIRLVKEGERVEVSPAGRSRKKRKSRKNRNAASEQERVAKG